MIPSIEDIIRMLKAGECTAEEAEQWIGSHIDLQADRTALLDTFASMVDVARDRDGELLYHSVTAVMGYPIPAADPQFKGCDLEEGPGRAKAFEWWCLAEARIRYAKASAMMEARCL